MIPGAIPFVVLIESLFLRACSKNWSPPATFLSIQLRLLAYIFLRWFPAPHFPTAVLATFALWSLAYHNLPKKPPSTVTVIANDAVRSKLLIEPDHDQKLSLSHSASDDQTSGSAVLVRSSDLVASQAKDSNQLYNKPLSSASESKDSTQTAALLVSDSQLVAQPPNSEKVDEKVSDAYASDEVDEMPTESTPLLAEPESPTFARKPERKRGSSGPVRLLKSLVGLTTDSTGFNRSILFVNALLTLFCLDATFRPLFLNGEEDLAFVRVGAVGETWAKIHARIPPSPATDDLTVGAIVIYRTMKPVGEWIVGPKLLMSNLTDWTSVVKIDELWPGTSYEYRLTLLSSPAAHHDRFPTVGRFKTVPDSRLVTDGSQFTFGHTSCIKPGFPYNPLRPSLHNDGAEQLAEVAHDHNLDFILFLGDFIYADAPYYAGSQVEDYWRKYRQSYASAGWKKLIQSVRTIHIYDDHEIFNDWAGQNNDHHPIFASANEAYNHYLGSANYDGPGSGENYYWFRHGDAAFFVWDCRRYRSANEDADDESKTMLGLTQKQVYLDWLGAVNSTVTFKFVISSTPFMTLWSGPDGAIDTWAGFMTERSELMDVMQYIPNLIVLSGDRHEFAAATIRETVIEFSTSPLNQFWLPIKTLNQENGLGQTGEDKLLKYIPEGNHKFSTIAVDTRDPKQPKLKFNLFIDGQVAWNLTYVGKSLTEPPKQLGELFPSWEQFMSLLHPIKWLTS